MLFFTLEKIAKLLPEIRKAVHRETHPITRWRYSEGETREVHRPELAEEVWEDFKIAEIGSFWGGYDVEAWFRTTLEIPRHLRDKKLVLRFLVGPHDSGNSTAEALLYVNGEPLQAIDVWHEEAWLPPELVEQGELEIALHTWSGVLKVPPRRQFKLAQLVWVDEAAERFYYFANTLLQAIKVLDEDDLRRVRLLEALNDAFNRIDFVIPKSEAFYHSVVEADAQVREAVRALAHDELKPTITAVGHAHIDMAWLWRLRHTREKAARTFTTVLHLMRQYPEYRFMHSSPQLYKFLEEDYPELFEQVKARIQSGEWEITGGMWVESDVNVPSGESLVRQFLFGKRYMRETFGVESTVLWLPDVFGYSYALPQIMKKCGMTSFMTTKISWNQFNRFPHDTFLWRGLDGTEMPTHFVTTPERGVRYFTYNGQLKPAEVMGIWEKYQQKSINDDLLFLFGWGDGGGGPTQIMLESARAMENLPGIPRVRMGHAEPYFERLAERMADADLPVWDGELYFEYHRGTYTSQAQVKRANRESEILYHKAEWLSTLATLLAGSEYPQARLNEGWERILLNQFHDILPGSSIREVYEDTADDYAWIRGVGQGVVEEAQAALLAEIPCEQPSLAVFNPLGWRRGGLLSLPASVVPEVPEDAQQVEEAGAAHVLLPVGDVPSLGYRLFPLAEFSPSPSIGRRGSGRGESARGVRLQVSPTAMENGFFRIELNERGQLTSLYDKRHEREVLAEGARGNVFQAFEDKPLAFDAWDIDLYYQEKMWEVDDLIEAEVEESGLLRGTLRLQWRWHDSTITQRLTIFRDLPRVDFRTEVDWREQQVLLKVAFPVNVRATRATYDIQFGSIERPTHWNTSWDWARFEVSGHKWADLSEGNYGVAVLNDCKYGHDIKDNVMRLTLIKSAIRPDPLADKGLHRFTYSLFPHAGDWRAGGVVQAAYELNNPLLAQPLPAQPGGTLPPQWEFASVDTDHLILETIKKAEDGDAWVVRVYEYQQSRTEQVTLSFARPLRRAVECNLIEEEEQPVEWGENRIRFGITPFEIKTFKVWF